MELEEFEALFLDREEKIRSLLLNKGKEYARGDRLSNFKKGAVIDETDPVEVWWGYYKKHLVSIIDMIKDHRQGIMHPYKMWREKLDDMTTYEYLLVAILKEESDARTRQSINQHSA